MCANPFRQGVAEYGCGQCMPCRLNRRRLWTARLMLESYIHESSLFVTLTYNQEHLPHDKSLRLRDLQLFLKRVRSSIAPQKVRYFAVGEYGERGGRPHYHLCLFGLSDVKVIASCWTLGMVHVGTVTAQSAAYVVGYVCKGMTSSDDVRLKGRMPEFARMSLKPGIGAGAVAELSRAVCSRGGVSYVIANGDVPGVFRFEGKKWPIGRYLRKLLVEASGYDVDNLSKVCYTNTLKDRCQELIIDGIDVREGKRLQCLRRAKILHSMSASKRIVL